MQGPLPPPHPLPRTHDDGTQVVFVLPCFLAPRGGFPPLTAAVLIYFTSVLNQGVTFPVQLGSSSSNCRSAAGLRLIPNLEKLAGDLFIYMRGLYKSLSAPASHPHTHTWSLPHFPPAGVLQQVPSQGHLGGSCWAEWDCFFKSPFRDFELHFHNHRPSKLKPRVEAFTDLMDTVRWCWLWIGRCVVCVWAVSPHHMCFSHCY